MIRPTSSIEASIHSISIETNVNWRTLKDGTLESRELMNRAVLIQLLQSCRDKDVCTPGWYGSNGSCLQQCPSGTYAVQDDSEAGAFCALCHYLCLSCKGPSETDCVTCHADSELTRSNGAMFCVLSRLSWQMQYTVWFSRMTMAFLVNMCLMIVIVVCLALYWYLRRRKSAHKYSKVSYSGNGEAHADTEQLRGSTCISDSE
ncbi:hypothetical protein X777_00603 [Ooceraea biroi]|uniref:Furin n=1 Tax=Ooceraea biroi TaxID=2015173 RepID=A0A026X1Q6_OOCBI|nr:hypothetical protein X777_00603 [Ooceraea biroi]